MTLTQRQIEEDIRDYQVLLDSEVKEEEVHQFLAEHIYFFNGMVRTFSSAPLYSKVKLGIEHEMDFCYMDPTSFGPVWNLIEIERPGKKLFTKSGDPTSELTHAIRQVQDWQDWIAENKSYAEKLMPLISYPKGIVIMGRRGELSNNPELMKRLKRINYDYRPDLEIVTFDRLTSNALSILKLAKENGGSFTLSIPSKAQSHKDLKEGLPEAYQPFINYHKQDLETERICLKLEEEDRRNIKDQGFDSFHVDV